MTYSMTGFAALEQTFEQASENMTMVLELRAVNSRYLDLHFKLDDTFRHLEPMLREKIAAKLGRGKVECKFTQVRQTKAESGLQINPTILAALADASQKIQSIFPQSTPLSVGEILRWPNILQTTIIPAEALQQAIENLVNQGVDDLNASRLREGEKLKNIILDRVQQIELMLEKVKPVLAQLVKEHQLKLEAKLQEVMKTFEQDRMAQELALFMQRVDVDEELTRLTTHIAEVRRVLNQSTPAGKRLDFLMQELNREANTLGSKSVSVQTSQVSMELKVLIEQMREQVQNIE